MPIREFHIQGMSCANCAMHVEKALRNKVGNDSAVVNFSASLAVIDSILSDDEIVATVTSVGYQARPAIPEAELAELEEAHIRRAKLDMVLAIGLALPVFLISMLEVHFPGSNWVQLVLSTVLLAWPGRVFFVHTVKMLRRFSSSMDTLVATGTGAAYLYSLWLMFVQESHHLYFESAAVIIALILAGRFLEERARQGAARSVRALMALQPEKALLLRDIDDVAFPPLYDGSVEFADASRICEVSTKLLRPGQRVLVRRGDRIPVDGIVVVGVSSVDEAMLTGESLPVDRTPGSKVSAGTINLEGPIEVSVTAVGSDSALGHIIATVKQAIGSRAPIQRIADKVASVFVPSVVAVAIVTLCVWILLGKNFDEGLLASIAVLVVSCPCALGLATPTAILVATGRAASAGILIKDAPSLEILHKCKVVVLDKTGTLTTGEPAVVGITWRELAQGLTKEDILRMVMAVERRSSHPLARGLVRYVAETVSQDSGDFVLGTVSEIPGVGLTAELNRGGSSFRLHVGRAASSSDSAGESSQTGTQVGVSIEEKLVAVIRLRDVLRSDAADAIRRLRNMNVEVVMATGDAREEAERIGESLGISVYSRLMPQDKVSLVSTMQQGGRVVVMVGDGINDAPAMAAANVGMALGTGTDVAMATAGITLRDGSIGKIAEAIELSHATFINIKQNLFWAFAYNVVLIPVAAIGRLTPMLAAGAMAFSSLLVVGNALRLRRRRG